MNRLTIATLTLCAAAGIGADAAQAQHARGSIRLAESGLPGADDPALRDAVAAWLDGNDADAVPTLVALANADNLAAQIFIGTIDARGQLFTPWFEQLPSDDQRAIVRRMDSRFGTSWLSVAEDAGSRLAALLGPPEPGPDGNFSADTPLELVALGEPRATITYLGILFNQGMWREVLRLEQVAAVYGMQPMVWAAATQLPAADGEATWSRGLDALEAGGMDGYSFLWLANLEVDAVAAQDNDREFARAVNRGHDVAGADAGPLDDAAAAFLAQWLAETDEAVLLRRWCAAACPDAPALCAGDLYALLAGRMTLPYVVATPLETLIPQDLWNETPRALMVLEQYALHVVKTRPDPAEALGRLAIAQCVKDGLADTLAAYQ